MVRIQKSITSEKGGGKGPIKKFARLKWHLGGKFTRASARVNVESGVVDFPGGAGGTSAKKANKRLAGTIPRNWLHRELQLWIAPQNAVARGGVRGPKQNRSRLCESHGSSVREWRRGASRFYKDKELSGGGRDCGSFV